MAIYDTIKEIYFCLDYGDRQLLDRFNLTVPRFFLLKHIRESPGMSLTQLSVRMISDKSNITRLIQALETDGLVVRRRHKTDRRTWSLYLSESGARLLCQALEAHADFTRARFKVLNDHSEALLEDLMEIKRTLELQLEQPSG